MFVPYSHITASVSLYTTSHSPFLPVCLFSRRPLTIFFSLRPLSFPYFSLLFLSFLLSRAHISHISLIPPAFLPHSSPPPTTLPKPEVTKSDKKKKQAADTGNPSGKKKIGTDKSNTRKTGRNRQRTGSTRKVPGKARQYKIPQRTSKGRKAESGSSPKNCRKAAGSLPAPTTLQHRAYYTIPLPPLRGSRITGYHVNFKNRLR